MSQQPPPKSDSLLNSQSVPLSKPQQLRDMSREAGRIARQLEGLTKAVRQLDKRLKEAT